MSSDRPTCPTCSASKVAEIHYGMPFDLEAIETQMKRGEIVHGGCDFFPDMPRWHCLECGRRWGTSDWGQVLKDSILKQEQEHHQAEIDAEARGIFVVTVNRNGYVKCPHCQRSFSIRYPMSWDGKMHKSCHTRIFVTNSGR